MQYIFKQTFLEAPICTTCMLSFERMGSDNETHTHCAALGSRPRCVKNGCRKDCPLIRVKDEGNSSDYTNLRRGSPVWYVDYEESQIEKGAISGIYFNEGKIETFSVDFENGDFDEFMGEAMGKHFFTSEEKANIAFVNGNKVDSEK